MSLLPLKVILHQDRSLKTGRNSFLFANTGELGYEGPLYARLLAMTNNMLCPSPMHFKYVYWTMRRQDSVCRNSATTDQYHGIHDAIYNVISIVYAGQTRV